MTVLTERKFNHIEAGDPRNPKGYRICGANLERKYKLGEANYPVCCNHAGMRTDHKGFGRCYRHGGSSVSGPDNPAFKHGRQAYVFQAQLRERYRQVSLDDPDPLDLMPELAMQRHLLSLAFSSLLPTTEQPTQPINSSYHSLGVGEGGMTENTSSKVSSAPSPLAQLDPDSDENTSSVPVELVRTIKGKQYVLIELEKIEVVNKITANITDLVTKVIASRNQTALTVAEVKFIRAKMVEIIERFIPDPGKRSAFVEALNRELPGGDEGGRDAEGDRQSEVVSAI